MVHTHDMAIPSVTICNINRVHCGNLFKKVYEYNQQNEVEFKMSKYRNKCNLFILFKDRKGLLCKLFVLTGCDVSIQIAEKALEGVVTSNFSICDNEHYNYSDIRTLHTNLKADELEQGFLDLYLKLNQVRFCSFI